MLDGRDHKSTQSILEPFRCEDEPHVIRSAVCSAMSHDRQCCSMRITPASASTRAGFQTAVFRLPVDGDLDRLGSDKPDNGETAPGGTYARIADDAARASRREPRSYRTLDLELPEKFR